ncbi:MAG TPA: hypothetical protein VFD46_14265 [Chryseolinea sp.]|nr:hypothetical protein [Chryseolinea sp.]
MKIIAQTPNERVLVSLTDNELANLLGEYSRYDVKREFMEHAIKNETEIEISDIYQKHRLIADMQKNSEYESARHQLEKLLRALTPIENKIAKLSKCGGVVLGKK